MRVGSRCGHGAWSLDRALSDRISGKCVFIPKVHSRSVDPQKNCCSYLITYSIKHFPALRRSSLQRHSFDIYIYI